MWLPQMLAEHLLRTDTGYQGEECQGFCEAPSSKEADAHGAQYLRRQETRRWDACREHAKGVGGS